MLLPYVQSKPVSHSQFCKGMSSNEQLRNHIHESCNLLCHRRLSHSAFLPSIHVSKLQMETHLLRFSHPGIPTIKVATFLFLFGHIVSFLTNYIYIYTHRIPPHISLDLVFLTIGHIKNDLTATIYKTDYTKSL